MHDEPGEHPNFTELTTVVGARVAPGASQDDSGQHPASRPIPRDPDRRIMQAEPQDNELQAQTTWKRGTSASPFQIVKHPVGRWCRCAPPALTSACF
ncbi:hypothetical protein AB1Y20_014178 [Prymnesium parvum]|uniref:Uncharacterized protein n=1 Tax=Prymnesium parvum TaxID=97485 RepID=A0AB34IF05_PRYPA